MSILNSIGSYFQKSPGSFQIGVSGSILTVTGNVELIAAVDTGFEQTLPPQSGILSLGTGSAGTLPKFITQYEIGNSLVSESGTVVTINGSLAITSTTLVTNLNADRLDSQHGTYYLDYTNFTNLPTLVSGSSQVIYTQLSSIPAGIVSGSSQITYSGISGLPTYDNYSSWTLAGNSGTNQTISSGNTATISGSHGLTAIGENTDKLNLRHTNNITAGSANSTGTSTLTYGGTFVVPSVSYDANGHITSTSTSTLTMPASDNTNTVTRLQGTGGTLVSGDIVIQGTGLVSTSQSGQTITIATTATSNTGTVTSVATGTGLSGGAITTTGTINLSLNSLAEKTGNLVGTDRLVGLTGTTHWAETISAIPLSIFSNDSAWTSNAGTVTSVTAGNGMTQSGTSTINPTLNVVSHAGSAGTIGTINVGTDAIGVNLGSTSTTACAGNDSRLSDARTPSNDANIVHISGTETATGAKTFSAITTFSSATASTLYTNGAVVISAGGLGVAGNINASGEITAYATSDIRLKNNITPITNPIYKIQQLSGNTFDWNEELQDLHKGSDVGVIAQEVEQVLPEIVTLRENGYLGVKYEKIVPLLIEAIKEQQNQIDDLKKEIFKLKRK